MTPRDLGKQLRGRPRPWTAGERHPAARLTADAVRDMRRKALAGVSQVELAEAYGVSQANVSLVILGRTWRGV